ncbi:sterol desaturase family protein [Psychrosphaera sp. 1_MG-2023]|uniref:sterol desaturase family protein n=1 Tax=Psychrosphaera sp. 1_MG-2023 TaxID=3062643 RepID=UPI0026E334AB|nr:sterol desaturase family protein [Psychrosphaera sp. 1_MG-2023]MDO6719255.1 sterol desaturase family protein [Psychrosphaera sp. 1_MG-2023]
MTFYDGLALLNDNLLAHVTSPNKRLFWGYIIATLAIVFVVSSRHKKNTSFLKYVLDKRIWLHRSAVHDYVIFIINIVIKTLIITPFLFAVAPIAIWVSFGLENIFGELSAVVTNKTGVAVLFTVMLFLMDDLTRFLLHLALHKIPVLWAFHKVHHSAQVLTPVTVYRIHPVESALYAIRLLLVNGLVLGLGFYLFSYQLRVIDILGANMFIFAFNVLGANLRHSHVWFSWPKTIEKWFISPAQHQVHHSRAFIHRDKNFGTTLAIWDRMTHSLVCSHECSKPIIFGVRDKKINQSVVTLYFKPIGDFATVLVNIFKRPTK